MPLDKKKKVECGEMQVPKSSPITSIDPFPISGSGIYEIHQPTGQNLAGESQRSASDRREL